MNSELVNEILKVQRLMNLSKDGYVRSKKEDDLVHKYTMRIARHLPSPSKLNAGSVLLSNEAEKVAEYIEQLESDNGF
jgi:hypothetical protein